MDLILLYLYIYYSIIDDECDKQIEESIDCSICLGSALFPIRIPCGHIFCFLCIKGAARQAKKCPLCRQHVPVDFNKNPVLLKRQGIDTPDDGHQWYYEGKNGMYIVFFFTYFCKYVFIIYCNGEREGHV